MKKLTLTLAALIFLPMSLFAMSEECEQNLNRIRQAIAQLTASYQQNLQNTTDPDQIEAITASYQNQLAALQLEHKTVYAVCTNENPNTDPGDGTGDDGNITPPPPPPDDGSTDGGTDGDTDDGTPGDNNDGSTGDDGSDGQNPGDDDTGSNDPGDDITDNPGNDEDGDDDNNGENNGDDDVGNNPENDTCKELKAKVKAEIEGIYGSQRTKKIMSYKEQIKKACSNFGQTNKGFRKHQNKSRHQRRNSRK